MQNNGFTGKKNNLQSRSTDPNDPYNLVFNSDGLLEVDNVILKITDDNSFIYTLKDQNYSTADFNNLVNEIFDATKMNKINVDRDPLIAFELINFVNQNPAGVEESLNTSSSRRPMFGTSTSTTNNVPIGSTAYSLGGGCVQMVCNVSVTTHYFFWINTGSDSPVYNNCHNVSVTPPPGGC